MKHREKVTKWIQDVGSSLPGRSSFAGISPTRIFTGLVIGLALLALFGDLKGTLDAHIDARVAEARSQVVMQINEYTQGRIAVHKAKSDSLQLAVEAAEVLNGELVAALAIRIPADTVYLVERPTDTQFDSTDLGVTRTATLTDTTDMGIEVTVNATAPAVQTAPLSLGYRLFFPEQRPEVAFIETEMGVVASVSWLNQNFQVEAPYYRPQTNNPKPLRINAGARMLVPSGGLLHYDVFGEIEYRPNAAWSVQVPVGLIPDGTYVGLGVRKTLASYDGLLDFLIPF